uniref:Uncharacterized protein n=1 Tax=Oryza glaberrima TaxID=4538 RepID=I1NW92_ORYGL
MAETGDQHGPVIGIDLGKACSCVAVWQNGRAEIVTNEHGGRATPSYAAFTDTERLVGDAAKSQASRNPTNTVFATKRLMGRRFSDASVQDGLKLWPFKVVPGRGDKPMVAASYKGKQKLLAAEEVASMLLSKMKAEAEAYIGGQSRTPWSRCPRRSTSSSAGPPNTHAPSRGSTSSASSTGPRPPPSPLASTKSRATRMCSSLILEAVIPACHSSPSRPARSPSGRPPATPTLGFQRPHGRTLRRSVQGSAQERRRSQREGYGEAQGGVRAGEEDALVGELGRH